MRSLLRKLGTDRRGATAMEYAFILALLVIAMMAAMRSVGTATSKMWQNTAAQITAA